MDESKEGFFEYRVICMSLKGMAGEFCRKRYGSPDPVLQASFKVMSEDGEVLNDRLLVTMSTLFADFFFEKIDEKKLVQTLKGTDWDNLEIMKMVHKVRAFREYTSKLPQFQSVSRDTKVEQYLYK